MSRSLILRKIVYPKLSTYRTELKVFNELNKSASFTVFETIESAKIRLFRTDNKDSALMKWFEQAADGANTYCIELTESEELLETLEEIGKDRSLCSKFPSFNSKYTDEDYEEILDFLVTLRNVVRTLRSEAYSPYWVAFEFEYIY
jgi:hypothetical protein